MIEEKSNEYTLNSRSEIVSIIKMGEELCFTGLDCDALMSINCNTGKVIVRDIMEKDAQHKHVLGMLDKIDDKDFVMVPYMGEHVKVYQYNTAGASQLYFDMIKNEDGKIAVFEGWGTSYFIFDHYLYMFPYKMEILNIVKIDIRKRKVIKVMELHNKKICLGIMVPYIWEQCAYIMINGDIQIMRIDLTTDKYELIDIGYKAIENCFYSIGYKNYLYMLNSDNSILEYDISARRIVTKSYMEAKENIIGISCAKVVDKEIYFFLRRSSKFILYNIETHDIRWMELCDRWCIDPEENTCCIGSAEEDAYIVSGDWLYINNFIKNTSYRVKIDMKDVYEFYQKEMTHMLSEGVFPKMLSERGYYTLANILPALCD